MRLATLFIILAILTSNANAKPFINVSTNHLKINDGYKYETKYRPSFAFGYSILVDDYFLTITTNRLNLGINKKATKNDITYNSYSKINADTLSVGIKHRNITYSAFVANTEVRKKLFHNGNLLGIKKQHSFIYGLNFNYFLNKHLALNTALIAPNQEFDLDGGINVGINYFF